LAGVRGGAWVGGPRSSSSSRSKQSEQGEQEDVTGKIMWM
jgi:hypothetical protein